MLFAAQVAKPGQKPPPKPPLSKQRRQSALSIKLKLEALGEEKYNAIRDRLLKGASLQSIAVELQRDHWQEMKIPGIAKGLQRCRDAWEHDTATAEFIEHSATLAKKAEESRARRLDEIHDTSMGVLGRLITVTNLQMDRLQRAAEMESKAGKIDPGVSTMIRDYADLLGQVQKTQFELGINEFKGPMTAMRGVVQTTKLPDGTTQERHVYEAVTAVEEIFKKRGIMLDIPATPPTPMSNLEGVEPHGTTIQGG